MNNFEHSFEEYATKVLPRRTEMIESLIPHAFKVNQLFKPGTGEKGVIKKLGRMDDFKGFYAFVHQQQVVYVGTSEKVINRLIYHIKGHTKYQAHLAWELAKAKGYWVSKKMEIPDLDRAKQDVMKMKIIYMEVTSPIERQLLEIYAAMHFDCKYYHLEG